MSLTNFISHPNNLIEQGSPIDQISPALKRIQYLMGTFVEIEASGQSREHALEAIDQAFKEMKRIEFTFSKFLESSEVSKINRKAAFQPVGVKDEVFHLIEESVRFAQLTGGAFDITIDPLTQLWKQAQERNQKPTQQELAETLSRIGYEHLMFRPATRRVAFLKTGMGIDFGGIGKGYAIDRAIAVLRQHGIQKAMISCESTICCLDESGVHIGIKNPLKKDAIIATVALVNQAISTSALYEQFFRINGKKYGHIINPKTGQPVDNNIVSVSILSSSAKLTDVYSTSVFILGLEKGMDLIERTANVEGIIITKSLGRLKIRASRGADYDQCE